MAWTAPLTAVQGQQVSANLFNKQVRDNLLETAPARAVDPSVFPFNDRSVHFVGDGKNKIVGSVVKQDFAAGEVSTSDDDWGSIGTDGPVVSSYVNRSVLIWIACTMENDTDDAVAAASFRLTGGSNYRRASDWWGVKSDGVDSDTPNRFGASFLFNDLEPGGLFAVMEYRAGGAGSGGSGTAKFSNRSITMIPM